MENLDSLILSKNDYEALNVLVQNQKGGTVELLENELSRARIVPTQELPEDVVSMNSVVSFRDIDTGSEMTVTLVYPHKADLEAGRVSVLAPVGAALIGLRVGQSIRWPLSNGKERTLEVVAVSGKSLPTSETA